MGVLRVNDSGAWKDVYPALPVQPYAPVNTGVQRFATAAARDVAISAPVTGQLCWLLDLGQEQAWNGTAWVPVGGRMPSAFAQWGGMSSPSAWTPLLLTTAAQKSVSPGGVFTIEADGTFKINIACTLLVTIHAEYSVVGTLYGIALGTATGLVAHFDNRSVPANTPVITNPSGRAGVQAGQKFIPWISSAGGANLTAIQCSLDLLSAQ